MINDMDTDSSGDQFADIARALSNEPGVTATLDTATATALTIVGGCDHAGISLVTKGQKIVTVAPTDDTIVRGDLMQYETKQGPCLQAIADHETVHAPDLLEDQRWPLWSPRVAKELGVRSVLALQLFVGPSSIGCLNLYSQTPHAYAPSDRVSAMALAAHIAVAMTAAQGKEDLESALMTRTVIGQAEGMLMQALKITAPQAFAALTRVSQARNIKLHLVAKDIVDNGIRAELFA